MRGDVWRTNIVLLRRQRSFFGKEESLPGNKQAVEEKVRGFPEPAGFCLL